MSTPGTSRWDQTQATCSLGPKALLLSVCGVRHSEGEDSPELLIDKKEFFGGKQWTGAQCPGV